MEALSFDEFIGKLKSRFESARTKEDYKLQLRFCYQKPGEDFESLADALLELVENACPGAVFDFNLELVRDRFLQEIKVSDGGPSRPGGEQPPLEQTINSARPPVISALRELGVYITGIVNHKQMSIMFDTEFTFSVKEKWHY